MKVLAYMNTFNRYDSTLSLAILSVINQTYKPSHFVIFDDTKDAKEFWKEEHFAYLMRLCSAKGISWEIKPGWKKGAHHNHETANLALGYDYNWFIDDDHIPEPTCLENLMKEMKDDVGAVGGLILKPGAPLLPPEAKNVIDDLYAPNIQWFKWSGESKEVEHIYSSFLYRPGIAHFDTRATSVSFRVETMFTYSLYLKGYKLIVTPNALMWHFEGQGGCRTEEEGKSRIQKYNEDQARFEKWLAFQKSGKYLVVLDNGKGDHLVFKKNILPLIKAKHPSVVIACCYTDIFPGETLISIADAWQIADLKSYNPYHYANIYNFPGNLTELFKKFYNV